MPRRIKRRRRTAPTHRCVAGRARSSGRHATLPADSPAREQRVALGCYPARGCTRRGGAGGCRCPSRRPGARAGGGRRPGQAGASPALARWARGACALHPPASCAAGISPGSRTAPRGVFWFENPASSGRGREGTPAGCCSGRLDPPAVARALGPGDDAPSHKSAPCRCARVLGALSQGHPRAATFTPVLGLQEWFAAQSVINQSGKRKMNAGSARGSKIMCCRLNDSYKQLLLKR